MRIAEPYSVFLDLLRSIPGFNSDPFTAIAILSEIGCDMSVFPSAKHLCSWAGCCPRNDQSGGKIKSTRISRAGTYLKPRLVQIANALVRSKQHPEFADRYRRIKSRRGHRKAIIAVCKMLLTAIYSILSKLIPYSPDGFLPVARPINESKVLTRAQGLQLLRLRGYTFKDDPPLTA
jgi:Transposase and inactivated derivatives